MRFPGSESSREPHQWRGMAGCAVQRLPKDKSSKTWAGRGRSWGSWRRWVVVVVIVSACG